MQADIARTFHSRLSPLRDAVDTVRTVALSSVRQRLTAVISDYRFRQSINRKKNHTAPPTQSWTAALNN